MFSLLPFAGNYEHIITAIVRCVVFFELVQNAWSFSVVAITQNQQGRTLLQLARRGQVAIPRRKNKREHSDEHRLEDVFLDEISASSGLDDDYHFDVGKFHFGEVVDALEILDDGKVSDPRIGGFDEDGGLAP
jgi:hypothetical protein